MGRVQITYATKLAGTHTEDSTISSATTLTIPDNANMLMIQAESQNVRIRLDGTDPDANTGFLITAGNDPVYFSINDQMSIRIIETSASATVQYQFFQI